MISPTRAKRDRLALLKALRKIQDECARNNSVGEGQTIQNVWRLANFAVHNATQTKKKAR